jgi:hypothetical protein
VVSDIRKLAKDHKGYGSAARGNCPPYFEKLRVGKLIIPPPFLALNLIKKLFYFSMEAYIVVNKSYGFASKLPPAPSPMKWYQ